MVIHSICDCHDTRLQVFRVLFSDNVFNGNSPQIYEVENYQNKQRQIENNVIRRRNFGIDVYTESQLYHTDNITFLHDKSLVCPTMSRCNV